MLQAFYGAVHFFLQIVRERGGKPLHVYFRRVRAFGFQKELVAFFIGKAHHLGFDRRAVTRTRRGDRAVVERRAVEVGENDLMRVRVGVGKIAGRLRGGNAFVQKGKGVNLAAFLHLHFFVLHRSAVKAGGRARFESSNRKPELR